MIVKLQNRDPFILVENMGSYFKHTLPDCSLFSEDNFEVSIHKEILYQTKFMQSMIKSADHDGFNSKFTIMCQTSKQDLERIINFLYHGEMVCKNQLEASELSNNLTKLFGFPKMDFGTDLKNDTQNSTNSIIMHCGKPTCKALKACICQLSNVSLSNDVSFITANEGPSKKQSFESESTPYNYRDIDVKEEIMDYDDKPSDFLDVVNIKVEDFENDSNEENYEKYGGNKKRTKIYTCSNCGNKYPFKKTLNRHKKYCKKRLLENDGINVENSEIEKKISCPICANKFHFKGLMKTHIRLTHKNICCFCYEDLTSQKRLKEHMIELHQEEKKQSCAICEKTFFWKSNLHKHIKESHKNSCHICHKEFNEDQELTTHISEVHPKKTLYKNLQNCVVCNSSYRHPKFLIKHMKSEHKLEAYGCSICPKVFTSTSALENHVCEVSNVCSLCGKNFKSESFLQKHMTHCGNNHWRGNKCSICDENFESRETTMDHIAEKHKHVKLYSCPQCTSKFVKRESMRTHIAHVHEKKLSNLCSFCGKNFMSKTYLRNHIAFVHEGKEPQKFFCTMCEYSSNQKGNLQKHFEYHHEDRTFQCPTCGEEFKSEHKLDGHIAVVHDRSKLFKCKLCNSEYRSEHYLKEHVEYAHEKKMKYICPQCGKSCMHKSHLRIHIRKVHENEGKLPYKCPHCDKACKTDQAIKFHIQAVHEGVRFKCSICDKGLTSTTALKRHIDNVHEKKRPFACDICNESFAQKQHMITHKKGKHKIFAV